MFFSVHKGLFDLFPALKIGFLVCTIDNSRYGDDSLDAVLEKIRAGFTYEKPQDHPHIKIWREAFRKLGIPAAKYHSSTESLLRRALKGGPFPRINPIVDLYNAMSLKYLVPMGGHDLVSLEGDVALTFARGDEPFVPMDSGETETVEAGEVVYKDKKEVLTRRWVWRQSNIDRATPLTRSIFIPIDVMEGLPEGLCAEAMQDMEESLLRNGNGRVVHKDILTKDKLSTEFQA
jgi:DNA/RNA-binding domain of Phe-tRNA-synthetase-like protein